MADVARQKCPAGWHALAVLSVSMRASGTLPFKTTRAYEGPRGLLTSVTNVWYDPRQVGTTVSQYSYTNDEAALRRTLARSGQAFTVSPFAAFREDYGNNDRNGRSQTRVRVLLQDYIRSTHIQPVRESSAHCAVGRVDVFVWRRPDHHNWELDPSCTFLGDEEAQLVGVAVRWASGRRRHGYSPECVGAHLFLDSHHC